MSEHSIDVDVNFNLNDIKKIFEKIMEGSDIDFKGLSDITKLDGEGQASLLKEISSTENKTKLLESFANLGIHTSIINDISKIVKDMDEDQDEQSDIVERTQNGMIMLLTLSKTMMKLLDDKFPITEKMKKELDIMNDVLKDQKLGLDDKLDILLRSVTSIFAPFKEQQPQAFKIVSSAIQPTFLNTMDKDQTRASIDIMMDFVKQVTDKYTQLIERMGGGQEQFRHAGEADEIENLLSIGADITEILQKYKKVLTEEQYKQGLVPSDTAYTAVLSTEVRNTMDTVEITMNHLVLLFNDMSTQVDIHLKNLEGDVETVVLANEERLVELQSTIELLNTVTGDFRTVKIDLKNAIERGLNEIKDDITDEFRQEIADKLIEVAINKRLMVDPTKVDEENRLDFLIKLVDHTFNTLIDEYESVINTPKSREALKEAGIRLSLATPTILNVAKQRYSTITGREEGLFPSDEPTSDPSFDMEVLTDMIYQIYDQDTNMTKHMGRMKSEMIKLVNAVQNTETVAKNTAEKATLIEKSFMTMTGATQSAANHLRLAKDSIVRTNIKVNEVVRKIADEFPGDDIAPLEFF